MKIGIINNSLGNVGSVYSALNFYKYDLRIILEPKELQNVDAIVLCGVGNFKTGISRLRELHFIDELNEQVLIKKKPVIGLCLGMQLFADTGYENGRNKGLGWINGEVVKMESRVARIPHIGWDFVEAFDQNLFKGMRYNYFYFMHSYRFIPENKTVIKAVTKYGDLEIVAAVKKDNIIGFQFHPEKSQGDGLRLLRNALENVL